MTEKLRLEFALLTLRIGIGSFMVVWASLKFFRPGWMVNVFTKTYGLEWVTHDMAFVVGSIQMIIVIAFITGFFRTWSYGIVLVMHATGVIGSISSLVNFTRFPNNLLWTSVATLAGLIALFLLRNHDNLLSFDGRRDTDQTKL